MTSAPDDGEAADLRRRLEQALAAVRARDDFLAMAAHELRSPMNALSLQLDMLERLAGNHADDAVRSRVATMKRTVAGFVRRATVLLDVARLNGQRVEFDLQQFQLQALVDDVLAVYEDEARYHGAVLRAEVEPGLTVRWDLQAAEQVLSNLVTNAIKHGGGADVLVRAAAEGDRVRLTVQDRGPGIAEAEQRRIFERFERIVGRHKPGFGVGLWIVGQLVRAQGGAVEVEPTPGGGTRFHVLLPRALSFPAPPSGASASTPP